jgi:hypothetical protein
VWCVVLVSQMYQGCVRQGRTSTARFVPWGPCHVPVCGVPRLLTRLPLTHSPPLHATPLFTHPSPAWCHRCPTTSTPTTRSWTRTCAACTRCCALTRASPAAPTTPGSTCTSGWPTPSCTSPSSWATCRAWRWGAPWARSWLAQRAGVRLVAPGGWGREGRGWVTCWVSCGFGGIHSGKGSTLSQEG